MKLRFLPIDSNKKRGTMDNIRRLETLVNELPDLSEIVQSARGKRVEYGVEGECVGYGLLNEPEIAVQRAFLTKGTIFPPHAHDTKELLIVYIGRLNVMCDSKVVELSPGGHYYFPHNAVHSVEALEDTWVIGITIPADGGYPRA